MPYFYGVCWLRKKQLTKTDSVRELGVSRGREAKDGRRPPIFSPGNDARV